MFTLYSVTLVIPSRLKARYGTIREGQHMHKSPSSFSFIHLFTGIGGLRVGFEAAGGTCVFTSEWNRFSQETL
ncbi:DNA cytosine methyltransferase [Thalassobacter stenotrophicus]|uniref:DNA cytosine methyltransferase n=1 Tax=Thalassobacter stenotrophicus TaxID=266809 RepID=UPI00398FA6B3